MLTGQATPANVQGVSNQIYKRMMEKVKKKTVWLTCYFRKFFNNLLFRFTLGDGANKQSIIGHRDAHSNVFSWSNFIVVALQKDAG